MSIRNILLISCIMWSKYAVSQVVILPSSNGYQSFFGTDNNRPAVFGYNNSEVMVISPPYGNIGVNTTFYEGNNLKYPAHAKLHLRASSTAHNQGEGQGPQLLLDQSTSSGFARLRLRNSRILTVLAGKDQATTILDPLGRYWDMAGFGNGATEAEDKLNFYHSGFGNILSMNGNGRVGIQTTTPAAELDNRGFTRSGELSSSYKTKLVEKYSFLGTCSSNSEASFSLDVHEDRIISVNVLVQAGAGGWYGSGDRFNNHEYAYRIENSTIYFNFASVSGCQFIHRDFRVWVTYTNATLGI